MSSIDQATINKLNKAHKPSASPSSGTSSGGNKLAQEINDEFLTCKICLDVYKTPKCLDCMHTFCETCIDSHIMAECTYKKYSDYREFTCPLCRKRTQLPIGGVKKLPDNLLVSGLSEIVGRQKPSRFPFCDFCKMVDYKHREASSKCLDCNKLLCKSCVDLHKETKVTKGHSIFDVEIEKDIECKEHSEEVIRFYCEPCETCICVLCTFNEHKDHEIKQFSEAVVTYKDQIKQLLDNCKEKLKRYDNQMAVLSKCEKLIEDTEQQIRESAIQFISDVRAREKQLVDDLHETYGEEIMEYMAKRKDMKANMENLKSTCSLTELVLQGKDIELLLLKKQVQEKLSSFSEIEMKDLPSTVSKQVTFVPGTLNFGELQEGGKPIVTKQAEKSDTGDKTPTAEDSGLTSVQTNTSESKPSLQTQTVAKKETGNDKSTATNTMDVTDKGVNTKARGIPPPATKAEGIKNENDNNVTKQGRRIRARPNVQT